MEIKRDKYVHDLAIRMNNGAVKVVTGIRRSGKSYLVFKLFHDYLIETGVTENHIIPLALDDYRNRKYRDPDTILDYVDAAMNENGMYWLLLDEVQLLKDFEEVLISLLHMPNLDIYVTGSNSHFLSKDIITEFRGRGDEIHIYPLSFAEFYSACANKDIYNAWDEYMLYGGLPALINMKTDEQKAKYLINLFRETYIRDITERNHINKTQELEDLIDILASSIGALTNPTKIGATFQSRLNSSISTNTLRSYIDCLADAFLISEAKRYDVKGRKYIGSPVKYYFEDVGLRNARLNFRQTEPSHLMENILYNELRIRGYQVDVGNIETRDVSGRQTLEIDFVANRGQEKVYVQSALSMPDDEKRAQEKRPLCKTGDSFKKVIITRDIASTTIDEDGIITMGLFRFLTEADPLRTFL